MTSSRNRQDFLSAVDRNWENYRKQLRAARGEISEESIHDLRVAARRFQALLRILRRLDPHSHVEKTKRFLDKQLDRLNEVRDAQVMLQEAGQRIPSLPQLGPFHEYLQTSADRLIRAAHKDLRAWKPSDLTERVQKIRRTAKKHAGDDRLVECLLQTADEAHAKTLAAFSHVDGGDPTTIHGVRIAFKKFRYLIETIQPLLPDYPQGQLRQMRDYQDAMGRIRDTTVFLNKLQEYEQSREQHAEGQPLAFDREPIELFYQTRLDELVRAYLQRKDELNLFWRATPEEPFPWEQNHDPVHRAARNRRAIGQQRRGAGQPAAPDNARAKEVPAGHQGTAEHGDADQPDLEQSLPAGS